MSGDMSKMPKGISDADIKQGFLMWDTKVEVSNLPSSSSDKEKKEADVIVELRKALQSLRIAMHTCFANNTIYEII